MALIKTIETNYGVAATYWHIGSVQQDYRGRGVSIVMYGFVTEQARLAGKDPIAVVQNVSFTGSDYSADMTREDLYPKIKLLPSFEGAEDA